MSVDANATRKLNELNEALEIQDDDLFYLVRSPFSLDTSFRLRFGVLRASIAALVGSGDVVGPISAGNNNVVLFDGLTGRNIKDSGVDVPFLLNRNNHTGQQAFSTLTGLPTTLAGYGIVDASPNIAVKEEGIQITGAVRSFNFVGPGVTASDSGGDVTVTVTGAGDMVLAGVQVNTGAKTFAVGTFKLRDSSATFFTTVNTLATSDQTVQIPATAAIDNFVLVNLAQTLTNKTLTAPAINAGILTSPQLNFTLDAPGDVFYRNAGNITTRLSIGPEGSVFTVVGGLPAWAPVAYRLLGYVTGVNLNAAAPIDLPAITISATKYIPLLIAVYNNSAAAATAQLGVFTAAGGGGTQVVAPAALAALAGANAYEALTLATLSAPLTAATLIPRLTVAAGGAATADIAVFGIQLPT